MTGSEGSLLSVILISLCSSERRLNLSVAPCEADLIFFYFFYFPRHEFTETQIKEFKTTS